MENVIMHTVGFCGILWAALLWLALYQTYQTVEVKHLRMPVTIKKAFFYPYPLIIFYIVWLLVG